MPAIEIPGWLYLDLTHITLFPAYSQLRAAVNQYFKREREPRIKALSTLSGYFWIRNFFFPSTRIRRIWIILNPLSRVKNNKSENVWTGRFLNPERKNWGFKTPINDKICNFQEGGSVFITKPLKSNGKSASFSVLKLFKATVEPRYNEGPSRRLAEVHSLLMKFVASSFLSYVLVMYQSNRSFNIPPPPGIPRAFDAFSFPGGREFDHHS